MRACDGRSRPPGTAPAAQQVDPAAVAVDRRDRPGGHPGRGDDDDAGGAEFGDRAADHGLAFPAPVASRTMPRAPASTRDRSAVASASG